MITSSSILYITEMLSEPQNITPADADSIKELIETYPYFVPARYMDAVQKHKEQPYSAPMMAMMQLYMNNWLLYSQLLLDALGGEDVSAAQDIPKPEVSGEPAAPVNAATATETEPVITPAEPIQHTTLPQIPNNTVEEITGSEPDEAIILPIYTEDYFLHQGINVSNKMPTDIDSLIKHTAEDKSLMVVMSFSEWLMYFKTKKEKDAEEVEDQKALKTMWQKEKLAAALEEENEEIPESVFKMAVSSITKEDDLASESFAEVYAKQGRYDKAIDMYRKLSLRNPQKKAYFARKIEALQKEKQS